MAAARMFNARRIVVCVSAAMLTVALSAVTSAPALAAVSQVGSCTIAPNTQCAGANLSGSDLRGADLSGANLQNANLSGARLDGATFRGANLDGAVFSQAQGVGVNLSSTLLRGANFLQAYLPGVKLDGSQLDGARLSFANLQDAQARSTNFAFAQMDLVNFVKADAHGANFFGAKLQLARLAGANIEDANFAQATFGLTSLAGTKTRGANFWPSNFDRDTVAVNDVFEYVDFRINAYGDHGDCYGHNSTDEVFSYSGFGKCLGSVDYSFDSWIHGYAGWEWYGPASQRVLEIRGSSVLEGKPVTYLKGRADGNWGAFRVTELTNLQAEPTGDRAVKEPGGPLGIDLRDHTYWRGGYGLWTGYSMQVQGWLRRKN
jgi:uncharacterized protein YjbI with pentapeptide repeats